MILHRAAPYNQAIVTLGKSFYEGLEQTNLTTLVLNANNIIILKAHFSTYTPHLTYLSMQYNRLMHIERLESPIIFNSSNQVANLKLDLSRNNINFISDHFFNHVGRYNLELFFNSNHLGEHVYNDIDGRTFRELCNLRKINLHMNLIKYLPVIIFKHLSKLESLKLGQNSLRSITFDIAALHDLT